VITEKEQCGIQGKGKEIKGGGRGGSVLKVSVKFQIVNYSLNATCIDLIM